MFRRIQLVVGVLLAVLVLAPYRPWIGEMLRFGLGHAILPAAVAILYGILFGLIGAGYGLPSLFWNDRVTTRFSAATASVLLLALIGTLGYLVRDPGPEARDQEFHMTELLSAWAPATLPWFKDDAAGRLGRFLLATSPPFLLLLLAPALLPEVFPHVPRSVMASLVSSTRLGPIRGKSLAITRNLWGYLLALGVWAGGLALGVAVVAGLIDLGGLVERSAHLPRLPFAGRARALTAFFLIFSLAYGVLSLRPIYDRVVSPAFAICALIGLLSVFASLIAYMVGPLFPGAALVSLFVLGAWFALANLSVYKLRFPCMGTYYPGGATGLVSLDRPVRASVDAFPNDDSPAPGQVDDRAALGEWRAFVGAGSNAGEKPRLVVIAVSGGALRSALWVATVVDRLEQLIPGFGRQVRIITGASGGMVGAAHYLLHRRTQHADDRPIRAEAPGPYIPSKWVLDIPRDSLSPVARFIALRDPLLAFLPRLIDDDRGIRLEDSWPTLGFPFGELADEEARGRIPSMILSPMTVESGRRLLISNLGLQGLLMAGGPELRGDGSSSPARAYSLSAMEFARMFPEAKEFRLATGVRMNASFPYVSPAVSLPTAPPRRVVDAGYYDNYGVQVAAVWMERNAEWLIGNTSGVLFVQIRDAISAAARLGVAPESTTFLSRVGNSFRFFTSPPEAAESARTASAMFRNDENVETVARMFAARDRGDRPFFTTAVFENSAVVTSHSPDPARWPGDATEAQEGHSTVPLSWYLSRADRDGLFAAIPKPLEGSPWVNRADRLARIAELRERIHAETGSSRIAARKALEQAENLERLVDVADWWQRP